MAGVFRFSNAVSDIRKFIDTYKVIYEKLKDKVDFTHDDATEALIDNGLVSSSGAIGQEAVNRSRRADRSRDPLYNQLKMYSEIYRMLGWYKPGSSRTNFVIPDYGEYIYDADGEILRSHYELNVLHIVSPNPLVQIRGGNILRPFPLILKLLERLDGIILRDEIILTVLACGNDREENYIDEAEKFVRTLRGDKKRLDNAMNALVKSSGISRTTLGNYTRFILASLKWLGYANPKRISGIYGKRAINVYEQTERAKQKVKDLEDSIDIRYSDLENFSDDENTAFAVYILYYHLNQIGYDITDQETQELIAKVSDHSQPIIEQYGISDESNILYFPYQETPLAILQNAKKYFNQND